MAIPAPMPKIIQKVDILACYVDKMALFSVKMAYFLFRGIMCIFAFLT
jgi:hypothetical protein